MDKVGDFIQRQNWLKLVEIILGAVADTIFNKAFPFSQKVRNFLHGTWLGHPFHPAITDLPVGAWTATTVFDSYELSTGDEKFASASDLTLELGLVGAVLAATSGLNDWNATGEKPRRVGALHALCNIGATACYFGSWWQRRYGCRRAGLTIGLTGYALTIAGAYLGGHLVYNERIGVNHAPGELPKKFTPLIKESKLRECVPQEAEVDGIPVVVVKRQCKIFVLAEKCSHLGGPLSKGDFDGTTITCPWHRSQFSIEDGSVVSGPATFSQPCLEVRARDGQVEARAPRGMVPNPY
jgi:nitrite reductase/ring-hydroxylating ferredoxin subunit/uncharacterized membrane protein